MHADLVLALPAFALLLISGMVLIAGRARPGRAGVASGLSTTALLIAALGFIMSIFAPGPNFGGVLLVAVALGFGMSMGAMVADYAGKGGRGRCLYITQGFVSLAIVMNSAAVIQDPLDIGLVVTGSGFRVMLTLTTIAGCLAAVGCGIAVAGCVPLRAMLLGRLGRSDLAAWMRAWLIVVPALVFLYAVVRTDIAAYWMAVAFLFPAALLWPLPHGRHSSEGMLTLVGLVAGATALLGAGIDSGMLIVTGGFVSAAALGKVFLPAGVVKKSA